MLSGFVLARKANSQSLALLDFGFAMSLSTQLNRFLRRGSERAFDGSFPCLGNGPACVARGEPWDRAVCGTLMFMAPEAVGNVGICCVSCAAVNKDEDTSLAFVEAFLQRCCGS